MNSKKKATMRKIEYHQRETIFLIIRGLEIGIVAGLISVLYRFLLSLAEKYTGTILTFVKGKPILSVLWILFAVFLGIIVSFSVKYEPYSSSSGIPQIAGEVKGYFDEKWWRVLIAKIFGGTLSILGGLSLGREGPSIQLGGMAAKGVARITKADRTTELRMISCGGGAGLAAAFNAPLAGVMFILEEIHKTIDKSIICMGIVASITADFVSKIFFGQDTVFHYDTAVFPLRYYYILIILGIVLGFSGAGYNFFMLLGQKYIKKIPSLLRYIIVFAISGTVGLFIPEILGGGHNMVSVLITDHPAVSSLIILLLSKFLFSLISFGSGAPGGIFFPLLILGTYIGAIYADITINAFSLDETLWQEFVVISMAGFFSSIVRAPLTGIILVFEMTGNMDSLLPLATVSLISCAVADWIKSQPIYAALLERMVDTDKEIPNANKKSEKVLKTYVVPVGSSIAGKNVGNIEWGRHCLVVSVERGEFAITPKGDTVIKEGDTLIIMVSQRYFSKDCEHLDYIINKGKEK